MRCLYYGCWGGRSGHFLHVRGGGYPMDSYRVEYYGDRVHLDGNLAPRRERDTGALCWRGQGPQLDDRNRIGYRSEEYPQGQYLLHHLDNGFTAIAWWDRTQGDHRGGCNSVVLLEGTHTSAELLAALREQFPTVVANLDRAGVQLVEVVR